MEVRLRQPSTAAIDAAKTVECRLAARTAAPIRRQFVERTTAASQDPPLARTLRGGRGGAVRLKLELSFLWFAAKAPFHLRYPARAWATLLDLPDPSGNGARRINDSVLWLERNGLVSVAGEPGQPNEVTLLSELGNRTPYELPGLAYNRLRATPSGAEPHRYFQLPNALWTNGWLQVLSGPGLAMLLVLYTELGRRDPTTTDLWFSPQQAELRFALSEDTRSKGLRELRAAGLVSANRRSISPDTFDFRRLRNVYRIHTDTLEQPAAIPESNDPVAAEVLSFVG